MAVARAHFISEVYRMSGWPKFHYIEELAKGMSNRWQGKSYYKLQPSFDGNYFTTFSIVTLDQEVTSLLHGPDLKQIDTAGTCQTPGVAKQPGPRLRGASAKAPEWRVI